MIKITALIVISLITLPLFGQQSQQRNVSAFSGIHAAEGIDVYLKQGDKESVKVEVTEGDIKDVVTEVAGTSLKVHMKSGSSKVRNAKVYVTYTKLDKVSASSGANIFSEGTITAIDVDIQASSGSNIELMIDAKSIAAEASSAGEIELKGKTDRLEAEAQSGASVDAYDLAAKTVDAQASSGGSMKISVIDNLTANASSAGMIRYRGNPGKSVTNSSSAGSVKKTN